MQWRIIDARTAHATYSAAGQTISATLTFDEAGDLIGFVSDDRLQTADGKTYLQQPWSTPVRDHRDYGPA